MPIKILLVDDNVDILVNVRDYFEMRGWTVETATTGTAAVERLERDAGFDLIVLDVGLPTSTAWRSAGVSEAGG